MGIRFLCPNGHKLHVKSFLAGKKGICPDCGAKVDIPYQSTRTSSKGEGSNPVSQAPPDTPLAMPVEPRGDSPPPKTAKPAGLPAASGEERSLAGPSSGAAPAESAAGGPIGGKFGRLPHPTSPHEQAQAVPMSKPSGAAPEAKPLGAVAGQPSSAQRQQPADPIDEAPQAVWYVRPKTGGQFGPAPGDVFRRWLDEGRVGSDSLIWREGWSEWKLASDSFARFTHAADAPPQPPSAPGGDSASYPPLVSTPSGRSPEQQRMIAKRNTANATIMFIILLVLATAALVPVLIWVLINR
ncbi:MAG: GYF domain-containing protein [Pirellulales bacterium]